MDGSLSIHAQKITNWPPIHQNVARPESGSNARIFPRYLQDAKRTTFQVLSHLCPAPKPITMGSCVPPKKHSDSTFARGDRSTWFLSCSIEPANQNHVLCSNGGTPVLLELLFIYSSNLCHFFALIVLMVLYLLHEIILEDCQ